MKPKLYIFGITRPAPPQPEIISEKPAEIVAPKTVDKITRSRLKELALSLDTRK